MFFFFPFNGPALGKKRTRRAGLCILPWKTILLIPLSLVLSSFHFISSAQEPPAAKNVLLLYSFTKDFFPELEPMKSTLRAHAGVPVNIYLEYLDSTRFNDPEYRKRLSATISQAYASSRPDLVIVGLYPALRFALDFRQQMFPDVPILFFGVDTRRLQGLETLRAVTGVTVTVDIRGSINLALGFHPDTQNIAVISGTSELEGFWLEQFRKEMQLHYGTLNLIEFSGLPTQAILDQVSALPPHTVVFAQIMSEESVEPMLKTFDLISAVSQRFPTYSIINYCMDHGCIGGSWVNDEQNGSIAGEIAARLLTGEKPENIPIQPGARSHMVADWGQLHRWNISEALIPPGTTVLNRPPAVWERYRKYIFDAVLVFGVQFALILALLMQRRRKRQAEAVLRESENRFRVMADSTPSLIWMCDEQGNVTYVNEQWVVFTGLDKSAGHGRMWADSVHPDDLPNASDTLSKALRSRKPFSNECRLRRRDGVYRWMFGVASPRVNGDGSFAGFIGSAVDVTDQRVAREALEKISGQLIEAQERERRRLARELHDDICQRLAMLSLRIEKASKGWGSGRVPVGEQLEQIWKQCSDLTGDVQALSHELHPSILDNLGLATAVKSFCREVSEQSGVAAEFVGKNIPDCLPREVALSLFRVVQEAVHNAIKYSGQKRFEVRLQGTSSELELEVSDKGVGFDTVKINGGGLGLVSMEERIHQVNGTFTIDSQPNAGTRIRARVPIATPPKIMTAAAN